MTVMEIQLTCGARKKSNGEPCDNPAGLRTEHPGEGRCYLHGGASPRGVASPHWQGKGRSPYTEVMSSDLAAKVESFDSLDPFDVAPEAALLRALLMDMLERGSTGALKPADVQQMADMVERITRVVERMTRMRNDTALTVAELKLVAARVADVVMRFLPGDVEGQRALITALLDAMAMPSDT